MPITGLAVGCPVPWRGFMGCDTAMHRLPQTVIEGFGSTSLTEVGTHFYLYHSGGTGPSAEIPGRGLCGWSIWSSDADWRGADGERVFGGLEDARRRSVFGVGH